LDLRHIAATPVFDGSVTAMRVLAIRSVLRRVVLAAVFAIAAPAFSRAASDERADGRPDVQFEIAAGGLIFSGNLNLRIDEQDVTLAADSVQVNYVIRNATSSDHTITIGFPFADLDGSVSPQSQAELTLNNSTNYMDAVFAVDGRRPDYAIEQRAVAVGLDATKAITDAGLPLFPFAADMEQRLAELSPAVRSDLAIRGVLKIDDDVITPAWTLKTTAYWRQVFPAGQTFALGLAYKPIVGRNAFSSGALQPLRKSVCIDAIAEQSILRLASEGAPLSMVMIGYAAHSGSEALGPVGRFRLTVEKPEPRSIAASCRPGLNKTGPTTSDWVGQSYHTDEEFRFLFVR
jgi:hypothetical protein